MAKERALALIALAALLAAPLGALVYVLSGQPIGHWLGL